MEQEIVKKKPSFKKFINKLIHMKYFSLCVWLLGFILVWEIIAIYVSNHPKYGRIPENYFPHFYNIIKSIFVLKVGSDHAFGMVMSAAGVTLSRALLGFGIGIVLGYILALLMSLSGAVEKIAFPYLMLIQMIPILGLAPIIFAITGSANASRIIIAAVLTFYPISTNVLAGFKAVEKEKHDLMTICAASKYQKYIKTMIPSSMPYFFTGLKIAAPLAITAAILVDTLQGSNSLGCLLSQSLKGGMSRYVFWQIVILSATIGIASSGLMSVIERIACPYRFIRKHKFIDKFRKQKGSASV